MTSTTTTTPTITYTKSNSKGFFEPPTQSDASSALERLLSERSESMLGNTEKQRPSDKTAWNTRKFKLQNKAKKLLPKHRVTKCCCWAVPGEDVEIWKSDDDGRTHYRNVETCKNVWVCPICSSRITEKRARELQTMLDGTNYQTVMVTYTMRHARQDSLEHSIAILSCAIRSFKSGRQWQEIKSEWGIIGTIKALEITWSHANGWHPHIHELLILRLNKPLSDAQSRHLEVLLSERWLEMLEKHGGSASSEHGLSVSPNAVDQYIAKFKHPPRSTNQQWTLAREIAKAASKHNAPGKSLSPFEILDKSGDDKQMSALFIEYSKAMKGKRQMVWSRGLRDLLELEGEGDEMPEEKGGEKIVAIPYAHWLSVVKENKRGELLKIAQTGTADDCRRFINVCHYRQLAKIEPNVHVQMQNRHPEHGRYE